MTTGSRTRPLSATALALALLAPAADAVAQTPAELELSAARSAYEATTETVRLRVIDAARKNTKLDIKTRQDQLELFKQHGMWPDATIRDELAPQVDAARSALLAAYEACLEATFAEDEELAKAIRAEWDQWERTEDLLPWVAVDSKLLESAGTTPRWPLPIDLPGTFRLEIRGTAKPGTTVRLMLPIEQGLILVPLLVERGSFHAILTFGPDNVLATDSGAARSQVEAVVAGGEQRPALDATDARIELLRWKNAPFRIVTEQEVAAAVPPEVAAQIRRLEKSRREKVRYRESQQKQLNVLDGKREQYEVLLRRRGNSADLRSDYNSCLRQIRSCNKRIDDYDAEIAEIDAQLQKLRAPNGR